MDYSRRRFIWTVSAVLAAASIKTLSAAGPAALDSEHQGNFRYIYGNEVYRDDFYRFLTNVFRLQPEDDLHRIIIQAAAEYLDDEKIYIKLQQQVDTVRPFLSELTYALKV